MYSASFHEDWLHHFLKLDNQIKELVSKKIKKILEYPQKRHLKGSAKYFVGEVGQYRIIYVVFEETNEVRFYFVGNHKNYEKWFSQKF
jgi:mRNA-degrading endonuclease RelE of RelBE toxin-antitoxin system